MEALTLPVEVMDGALNVRLGWLALLLQRNELVTVLGPGRYSRWRLWRQGITPFGLEALLVRSASILHQAEIRDVYLADDAIVDLKVAVRVRLNIQGDPAAFFTALVSQYGLDFDRGAEALVTQLIRESLQQGQSGSEDFARRLGPTRDRLAAGLLNPADVFTIDEVLSLDVVGWDEYQTRRREELQELDLTELQAERKLQMEAAAGNARAEMCLNLSRQLGVDPLYLWDPAGYQNEAASRREALVRLLGQYGNNVALLSEVIGADREALREMLGLAMGVGDARGPGALGRAGSGRALPLGGSASLPADMDLAADAEVRVLAAQGLPVLGGVYRELTTGGDTLRLLVVIIPPGSDESQVQASAHQVFGDVSIVMVRARGDLMALVKELIEAVTGLAPAALEFTDGEIQWAVPQEIVQAGIAGRFLAETVSDVFLTPPLVPLA